jgi:hypothetical protein
MMEAARASETSADSYQITRRNNSEDSHLHTRRLENLKRHFIVDISQFHNWTARGISSVHRDL